MNTYGDPRREAELEKADYLDTERNDRKCEEEAKAKRCRTTPETDAIVRNTHTLSHMAAKLTLKCEELEREREESREALAKMHACCAHLDQQIADERALADRLGNAVERYLSYQTNNYGEIMTALNSWKEARHGKA